MGAYTHTLAHSCMRALMHACMRVGMHACTDVHLCMHAHRGMMNEQGREAFQGQIIHAHELTSKKLESARAKHVVVCGAGKSAIDAAAAAAEVAASVTNVFRKARTRARTPACACNGAQPRMRTFEQQPLVQAITCMHKQEHMPALLEHKAC